MKHTNNPKRSRPRGGGKKYSPNRGGGGYESASSEGKLRGSPQQILDKYLALARDAQTAGDRIACEGYYQHAEHFYRVINADGNRQKNNNQPRREQGQRDRGQRGPDQQPRNAQEEKNQPQAQPQPEALAADKPIQADQQPQPQLDLQKQPEQTSEAAPQQADAAKPKRPRRPRRKPAEVKKIDIVKEEASKPDVAPVQVAEEKPKAAAS